MPLQPLIADKPVWIDSQASAKLDVYSPPTDINFVASYEGKILTAECTVNPGYPEPTIDISWTAGKTLIAESSEASKKNFQYELTPADKAREWKE